MSNENLESKRWGIAMAAIVMQLCLGTVYAWSVFKKPLIGTHGWGETETQLTFMIFMFMIGCAAAFGGTLVDKKGPKFVATIGGILFGVSTLLAGCADQIGSLPLLYLAWGLIGGIGNGFCYVTPIATLIRWFPDKRGLVTGLAVMGFGLGAFFMGKIAPAMITAFKGGMTPSGVAPTFYIWGVIFLVLVIGSAQLFKNPPAGWLPAGFNPCRRRRVCCRLPHLWQAVKTPQWWMLWGMLFLNVSAGLGLISQLSPLAQEFYKSLITDPAVLNDPEALTKVLAAAGGTVVSISAIFNGLGRLFWARVSDTIGRKACIRHHVRFPGGYLHPRSHGHHQRLLALPGGGLLPARMLRRRIRHHACLCSGQLRARLHRQGLRLHAHRMVGSRPRGPLRLCEVQSPGALHRSRSARHRALIIVNWHSRRREIIRERCEADRSDKAERRSLS